MKTIIVATDFSPAALNATNYAADMALAIKANLLLFHVYQLPLSVSDTPIVLLSVEELKESAQEKLGQLKNNLDHITSGGITITTESRMGNLSDELEVLCSTHTPFAVVMGTKGHSTMERTLFGSNTLSVIKHLTWPVICVPLGKEYGSGVKRLGLACDFEAVKDTLSISLILGFVNEFNAALHVLNVDYENRHFKPDTPLQSELLHRALEDIRPTYHFIENPDIEDGINEFAETNNLDMVITIPKKHKKISSLFRRSSTRQLVFESHVPVMCIHE